MGTRIIAKCTCVGILNFRLFKSLLGFAYSLDANQLSSYFARGKVFVNAVMGNEAATHQDLDYFKKFLLDELSQHKADLPLNLARLPRWLTCVDF